MAEDPAPRRIDLVGTVEGEPATGPVRWRLRGMIALHAAVAVACCVAAVRIGTDAGPARYTVLVVVAAVLLGAYHWLRTTRPRSRTDRTTPDRTVEAHRFTVRTLDDRKVTCVVIGDAPVHRDVVRVTASRARDGRYAVRRLDVLATPAGPVLRRLRARAPQRLLASRWVSRLGWAAAGAFALWTLLAATRIW